MHFSGSFAKQWPKLKLFSESKISMGSQRNHFETHSMNMSAKGGISECKDTKFMRKPSIMDDILSPFFTYQRLNRASYLCKLFDKLRVKSQESSIKVVGETGMRSGGGYRCASHGRKPAEAFVSFKLCYWATPFTFCYVGE